MHHGGGVVVLSGKLGDALTQLHLEDMPFVVAEVPHTTLVASCGVQHVTHT